MSHILVVDDNAIIREPISACLRQAGYETTCASSGREALEVMRTAGAPGLILLDLSMPEVDGLSLLRALRKRKSALELPVILLTAASDKQTIKLINYNTRMLTLFLSSKVKNRAVINNLNLIKIDNK